MIYLCGDTHIPIDISKLNTTNFPEQKEMTKKDYVIVLGDFGLIWKYDPDGEEKYWTKWLDEKNFTTLFLCGNHENFNRLKYYPESEFLGGKAHMLSKSIYHLIDNNIFNIDGKNFYVLGGAKSTDKQYRIKDISWWEEELPNAKKSNEVVDFITKRGIEVDYVLTHCMPSSKLKKFCDWFETDCLTDLLDFVDNETVNKKHWYCGHYHVDKQIDNIFNILYNRMIKL